jgi:hypothetical protein
LRCWLGQASQGFSMVELCLLLLVRLSDVDVLFLLIRS